MEKQKVNHINVWSGGVADQNGGLDSGPVSDCHVGADVLAELLAVEELLKENKSVINVVAKKRKLKFTYSLCKNVGYISGSLIIMVHCGRSLLL